MKQPYGWGNIYQNVENGISNITPNFMETQRIEVSDYFENKTIIDIPIVYSSKPALIPEEIKTTKYFVKAKSDSNFEKDNFSVYFPAGTFYDDFYLNFDVENEMLYLHEDVVPAHTNFPFHLKTQNHQKVIRKKCLSPQLVEIN